MSRSWISVLVASSLSFAALTASLPSLAKEPRKKSVNTTAAETAASPVPAPTAAPVVIPKQERIEAPRDAEDQGGYGKTHGIAGPVTFGPSLTLLALTRPFAGGLEAKYRDVFGLAGFYGFLPEIKISSVKVKYSSWDVRARWHVFHGAFFVGAAVGKQSITAEKSDTVNGIPVNAKLEMDSTFVSPHVGWQWLWKSGFFMGMDLGVQLSVSRSSTVSTDVPGLEGQSQYTTLVNDVQDKANKLGKIPLPMITFLKVGFLF